MTSRNCLVASSLWVMSLWAFGDAPSPFLQWESDNCLNTVGGVFVYQNPYSGKTDYFQLATVAPGGRCPYFPTNETSSYYWTYLPDEAAAMAAANASAALQRAPATTLSQIAHPPSVTPAKTPANGVCGGCPGAQNIDYATKGQPGSGFDAVSFRMRPLSGQDSDGVNAPQAYYWAYYNFFTNSGNPFYFGLQPEGAYGKTALFSVFGNGTSASSTDQYCQPGADTGAGTSCHIPYDWAIGKDYDFMVVMADTTDPNKGDTTGATTWEGYVYDVESQQTTLIGSITVQSSTGIEAGPNMAFDEYFSWETHDCPNQPFSEVLFFTPVSYYKGKPHNSHITSLNLNGGCSVKFYSDHSSYVYIEAGAIRLIKPVPPGPPSP